MTTLDVRQGAAPLTSPLGAQLLDPPRPPGRTLASYLLLPRPKDLVKAVVAPLGFAVGAASTGTTWGTAGRGLLVWVALELLVYQARYQWNDARGFVADQAHPEAASRGRLPGPVERARSRVTTSLAVAALRLLLTAAVALLVPQVAGVLLAMTVGVFGAAAVYEQLRSRATGRTAVVPPPVRPAMAGLWVWVGAGYAVRGLTGLAVAVPLGARPSLVVAATFAMWALGVVFVTCRWALEAMCFGTFAGRRLQWEVRPDQAREHTTGLVRWLPAEAGEPAPTEPCGWRALQQPTSLLAPWHLALVVALAAAAASGRLLVGDAGPLGLVASTAAGALCAVTVAVLPGVRLAAAAAGLVALASVAWATNGSRPLLAVLPVAVGLVLYGCFTRQCAEEVGHPLRRLAALRLR